MSPTGQTDALSEEQLIDARRAALRNARLEPKGSTRNQFRQLALSLRALVRLRSSIRSRKQGPQNPSREQLHCLNLRFPPISKVRTKLWPLPSWRLLVSVALTSQATHSSKYATKLVS